MARAGLTDFRQQSSGDMAFVDLPAVGRQVEQAGEDLANIETVKVDLAVPAPSAARSWRPTMPCGDAGADQPGPLRRGLAGRAEAGPLAGGGSAGCRSLPGRDDPAGARGGKQVTKPSRALCRAAASARPTERDARGGLSSSTEELRPEIHAIVPLSLLVLGDERRRRPCKDAAVITLDGCKLACATRQRAPGGRSGGQGVRRAGLFPPAPGHEAAGHRRTERRRPGAGPARWPKK